MSLGVCFLPHKASARVGHSWDLVTSLLWPGVIAAFETVPGWNLWSLSPLVVQDSAVASGTDSWIRNEIWMLKLRVVISESPAPWSFCSATVKCFEEGPLKVLVALEPLPVWLSRWQVGLWSEEYVLSLGLHTFWVSHTHRAWKVMGNIPVQPFSPSEGWGCIFFFPLHHAWLSFSVG